MRTARELSIGALCIAAALILASCAAKTPRADTTDTHAIAAAETAVASTQGSDAMPAESAAPSDAPVVDTGERVAADITENVSTVETALDDAMADIPGASPKAAPPPTDTRPGYKIALGTDPVIIPGQLGLLKVWIGEAKYSPDFSAGMMTAETLVRHRGKFAKIVPYTRAAYITIEDADSGCTRITAEGSSVLYTLRAREGLREGNYTVGAKVALHNDPHCEDSATRFDRNTTLEVIVTAAAQPAAETNASTPAAASPLPPSPQPGFFEKLFTIFENSFFSFWESAVGLFFTALLVLVSRKLYTWLHVKREEVDALQNADR